MQKVVDTELDDLFPEREKLLSSLFDEIQDFDFEMYNDFESLKNIILINSPFGTGKTFFAKKLEKYLDEKNINSIYLNVWENDYIKEPFLIIGKYIFEKIKGKQKIKRFFDKSYELFKRVGNIITPEFSNIVEIFEKQEQDPIKEFKNELEKLIREIDNKKLVLIIDELDRCRPDYAMKLLEIVKHFFNIKGLIIIVFENKKALNNSIKSLYNFDNEGSIEEDYISKFFIEEIKLSPINYEEFIIDELRKEFDFKTEITKEMFENGDKNFCSLYTLKEIILNICNLNHNISCRDLKTIIRKIREFYEKRKDFKEENDWQYIIPEIVKQHFSTKANISFISENEKEKAKKPYIVLYKENNLCIANNENYFQDKYKILNDGQKVKIDDFFNDFLYNIKNIFVNREVSNYINSLKLQLLSENYQKDIFFNFYEKYGEIETFNDYFEKAEKRKNILSVFNDNRHTSYYVKEIINQLIKMFEEKYDKKVENFQNTYKDFNNLSNISIKKMRLDIDKTINEIFHKYN